MYLDLDVCERCQGAKKNLEEAVSEVSRVLEAAGAEVNVHKVHVTSEDQARKLGFRSSPTIRINGKDIQLDVRESLCESCGDLCGEDVDCRVWVYQGREYTVPPKRMIIDAILREIYGGTGKEDSKGSDTSREVPENLKRFFRARAKKEANTNSCCGYPNRCNCR
jgi:glutaredoxin